MSIRALLDTHSFIWFIGGSERLSARARSLIESTRESDAREHREPLGDRHQEPPWQAPWTAHSLN
jgi:hypothetical protein